MGNDHIRLGIMTVASPLEVGADEAPVVHERLRSAFAQAGRFELVPFARPVMDPLSAVEAGRHFYDRRVDAICVASASWFEDYLILDLLEECEAPLILWARPGVETGSLCGMHQIGFMLSAMERPYRILYGEIGAFDALRRAGDFSAAAALRHQLRRARLGFIGHRVDGMTETTGHELAMKRVFGPRIVGIDTAVFLERAANVIPDEVSAKWKELGKQVGHVEVDEATGIDALRLYVALKGIIEEGRLTALAFGCYPNFYGRVCLAVSLLNEEGIPVGCEGDINSTLSMLIMTRLAGEPVHFAELLDPIPDRNSIVLSHCGSGAFSLARTRSEITLAPVRLVDEGLCCLFTGRPGPCTLINLGATMDGYRIAMLYGEALETTMLFRGNPLEVRFENDYMDVVDWVSESGLGHHWVAAYGDLRQPISDLAAMVGCSLLTM